MKLSYCYNKRSFSLCFQMPIIELHPSAGTMWKWNWRRTWWYTAPSIVKCYRWRSTLQTLIGHWYTGTRAFVHTWEHWTSSSAEDNFNFAQPIFFFYRCWFVYSQFSLFDDNYMYVELDTQSKCCHNKMLHLQSNPVFLLSSNILTTYLIIVISITVNE